ncbi:ABC transporter permease [Solimicrobium silvestre]|uniref:Putative ABC-type transport system involved in lysophospholipase L1 biosynthesis permease component n=1 Tax=Solimicrobium silvestre TaxID=2099400 RepID=A0A2S9GZX0_9BURK|nr:FtsX-like permease family protein [Solimicrobium silvestre]PRC93166.1 putative ABC-type transport system involved in lysophospholipase L1 biosynthesis permease component [Solimicrobium silvestre]
MLLQSLRMTWRDWRAGELHFLLIALVIAVGALSSVGFFVDRVSSGLQRDANQLLGADLVISSDAPIGNNLREPTKGLQQAETASFVSMAVNNDESLSKLVSVKSVSAQYPLRGHLTLDSGIAQQQIPASGTVWVDQAVLTALNTQLGQRLKLGDQFFTVSHLIQNEPDRGSAFINFAPRVMLAESDLAATNLIQPGSRVTYRLMLSGAAKQVSATQKTLVKMIESQQLKGVNLESLETGRPEMSSTLDRAKQFLSLVSLLSAMLAALAIALAARRFMLRHIDACAMLRCLGMTQTQVTTLFLIEFFTLGLVASLLGAALGYFGHLALLIWLGSFISTTLPEPSVLPALQGIAIGMLLLIGFAIPPILQLRNVPHNLMVRRETGTPQAHTIFAYLIGVVMFAILLVWQTGNVKLAGFTLLGFLVGMLVFAVCAWAFLRAMKLMRGWFHFPAWRFAINALQRRPVASIVQVVALSLGLMALLLLTAIRADLLSAWQQATPANAPNQFIINILPEQKEPIAALLAQHKVDNPALYPMIRGRLIAVNATSISAKDFEADNAKRMIEREFNLSTMAQMQSHNRLISGQWFSGDKPEASVEEGIAKTLRLKLGDKLRFDVAGQQMDVDITSIRKLDWGSMQVNFFVIINPKSAVGLPQTFITAFHLPANQPGLIAELSRDYPNLTIVDTGAVLLQLQHVLDQVVAAVQFLFLFTLACGLLVLYAALQSSQQQRLQEASLLRALGASKKQLSQAQWIEYGLLGSLAGLLAASGAAAIGWVLAHQVFEFAFHPSPVLWLFGLVAGALCALIGGWLGLRHILRQPPLLSLREA